MKKFVHILSLLLLGTTAQAVIVTVGSWTPIYKGIELATGRQQEETSTEVEQEVLCLRVDLTDPDIVLFTTPKCTNCGAYEVAAENTSHFVEQYGVQVAVNGGFYASSSGPGDVALGTPEDVYGLAMCTGTVVSVANTPGYFAALLFATNNQAFYLPTNSPATNTTGIYTAISGNHALLLNGVNLRAATPNDLDPRTALGLSADRRYLFLLTIDGRQGTREGVSPPWSDGADFHDTGEWLMRFGASDGINVDGGGSTTMAMADCQSKAVRLNRSSFVFVYGRERNIGQNFGVYAKPLPSDLKNLNVEPGTTTAIITWQTDLPGTTQVDYGLTTNYGSATLLDSRPVNTHITTLTQLLQGTNYYFRARSVVDGVPLALACQFSTLKLTDSTLILPLTTGWKYTTNNLDGTNWKAPDYLEPGWALPSPALLVAGTTGAGVQPKNTVLPLNGASVFRTYYFRSHFTFTGSTNDLSLVFSNFVDDGAVLYLNGAEIARIRMPAMTILNSTAATNRPCGMSGGDATPTCADVFTITGPLLTNLVQGDNVLAVEVHNYTTGNDVVFGSVLFQNRPTVVRPRLRIAREDSTATLYWNEEGFTLQQSPDVSSSNQWSNVPGPVTQSPYTLTNTTTTTFYQLRK